MNRTEKMNLIRNHCGFSNTKRSFFYRDEFVAILENILERELTTDEIGLSMNQLIERFLPVWRNQSTSNNHPSLQNVDYILSLLQDRGVEDQDVPKHTECLIARKDRVFGLAEFVLRGINPNFGDNILAVSVSENNPKEFTVILK